MFFPLIPACTSSGASTGPLEADKRLQARATDSSNVTASVHGLHRPPPSLQPLGSPRPTSKAATATFSPSPNPQSRSRPSASSRRRRRTKLSEVVVEASNVSHAKFRRARPLQSRVTDDRLRVHERLRFTSSLLAEPSTSVAQFDIFPAA